MIGSAGTIGVSGGADGHSAWADVACGVRGGRGVVPHRPQTLVPSSGSTTPTGQTVPSARPAWCFTPRKPLFLRPEAPRPQPKWLRRRDRRAEPLQLYPPQDRAGPRRGSSAGAAGTIHGNEKGLWLTADTFFVNCPKVLEFLCYCALRRGLPRRGPARSIRIPPSRSASA